MQQCMKSDISSTQGNRAAVPACAGTGTRVCWSGAGLGPGRGGGDCREGCLIARWFAGTAPGATLGLWQVQVTGGQVVGRRHDSHAFGNSGCDSRDACSGGCREVRLVLVGFL